MSNRVTPRERAPGGPVAAHVAVKYEDQGALMERTFNEMVQHHRDIQETEALIEGPRPP